MVSGREVLSYLDVFPPHFFLQLMRVALKYAGLILQFLYEFLKRKKRVSARVRKDVLHVVEL